jgi:TonB family protein
MLERYTEHYRARRRRPGWAVWLSIAAHAAAVVVILFSVAWRLDKLDTHEPPVLVAASIGMPASAPEGEAKPKPPRPPKPRKPPGLTQPDESRAEPDDSDDTEGDEGRGAGPTIGSLTDCPPGVECKPGILDQVPGPAAACGNGRVEPGEECDDGARAAGDGCSAACEREVVIVPAKLIEGQRIAGESQIRPPDSVQATMHRRSERRAMGTIHMCLDRDGGVRSLRVMRSTGYPEYDQRLTSRMREWRYRPYRIAGGNAVPVCTAVTFVFQLEGR